jgi:NitT/TauT family transport system substrate-binding protein
MRGEALYLDVLNDMHKFKGRLKGRSLKEVTPLLYDFRFVQ